MKQIVSLSGGRDSTAMLLMMLERGEQIDDIVFFDWGKEYPEMYEHLLRLEVYIGREITRLYPDQNFEYWFSEHVLTRGKRAGSIGCGWGWGKSPWCKREKGSTLSRYMAGAVICIGFSYEERFRRPKYAQDQRYPLLELGVTEAEALEYCGAFGFTWGGLYKHFKSVSCWCCPYLRNDELRVLRDTRPELWHQLLEMCERSPYPHPKQKVIEELTK